MALGLPLGVLEALSVPMPPLFASSAPSVSAFAISAPDGVRCPAVTVVAPPALRPFNDASGCLSRALLLASGHTGCGDLPDQRATAHVPMACRWPPVATCHRANFCSVVDSKRRILATRPCAETEHCDFAMRVLMAQEIEQLAYEH